MLEGMYVLVFSVYSKEKYFYIDMVYPNGIENDLIYVIVDKIYKDGVRNNKKSQTRTKDTVSKIKRNKQGQASKGRLKR